MLYYEMVVKSRASAAAMGGYGYSKEYHRTEDARRLGMGYCRRRHRYPKDKYCAPSWPPLFAAGLNVAVTSTAFASST